ncbi:MAG TPA: HD domain-containing protein [bacterium]|nr:HD domain-containing protein [bacterium]
MRPGPRFRSALAFAARLHEKQHRKGTGTTYVGHLIGVAALVIEDGGSEDEAIAALLHDAIEDQGGERVRREIRRRFGPRVARIVEACTDTDQIPKPPWRPRKEEYLHHLQSAPKSVLRVSLADKLHNARAILADYRRLGDRLWRRFKGKRAGTLWYYRELARLFARRKPGPMAEELARTVRELERLARRG